MSKHNHIDLVEFRAQSKEQRDQLTKFYNEVFSWEYKDWGEEYSDTHDSGLVSGIDVAPDSGLRTLTVVYSEDLDDSKKAVVDAGGTVIQDIYSFPGGKRFHFTDPAGNELAIWSDK